MEANTKRWVHDDEVSCCSACGLLFDWVRRKHHCRLCGNIFCALCTSKAALIPQDQILQDPSTNAMSSSCFNPQRTCDSCFEVLSPSQESLRAVSSNAVRENPITNKSNSIVNSPVSLSLSHDIHKAAKSISSFMTGNGKKDSSIPLPLLASAKGIAFLTVFKAGFVVSGRVGTGLVISRTTTSGCNAPWSAPSAIGTVGLGWGAQIGTDVTDFVLILNSQAAVDVFTNSSSVSLGGEIGVAAGPVGRKASGLLEAGSTTVAPVYSYSHSKGLFVGISLEGSVIASRSDINRKFYGKSISVRDLLSGKEPPPKAAAVLYEELEKALNSNANGVNRFKNKGASSTVTL